MTTAVIFYIEMRWVFRENCFGVRFNNQFLPKGACVVGFMTIENGKISELLSPPNIMEPHQQENWELALRYAREVLTQGYSDLEEEVL